MLHRVRGHDFTVGYNRTQVTAISSHGTPCSPPLPTPRSESQGTVVVSQMDDRDHAEDEEGSTQEPDVLQKLAAEAAQQQRLALEELQVRPTKVIFGSMQRDAVTRSQFSHELFIMPRPS